MEIFGSDIGQKLLASTLSVAAQGATSKLQPFPTAADGTAAANPAAKIPKGAKAATPEGTNWLLYGGIAVAVVVAAIVAYKLVK